MSTKVIETVTADRMADLRRARDASTADMVELRLDGVADVDVAGALEGRTKPVIVTCRPEWEGGRFAGSEAERLRLLGRAFALGAEFVDVEWAARDRLPAAADLARTVLSMHDFDGIPADLPARLDGMRRTGARTIKVAVTASRLRDCVALQSAAGTKDGHVVIAMGKPGWLTRLCPWLFGSPWTYGGHTADSAAPGQLTVRELIDRYRVRRTGPASDIYAVTGCPLGHSASPAMHNAALADVGVNGVYVPLETADAAELLDVAAHFGIRGVSVTAPLKAAFAPLGVAADPLAARVGAMNTLRRQGPGWEGRNFDVAGFLDPLERSRITLARARCVVLGAGGAARAAVFALAAHGARVEISARRADPARALAAELHALAVDWPPPPGWDLLVNTTPAGTWPHTSESPLPDDLVRGGAVYDLVYNPIETTLMRQARRAGARTICGLDMLVSQACLQFDWWTGLTPSRTTVERAALSFLSEGHEANIVR